MLSYYSIKLVCAPPSTASRPIDSGAGDKPMKKTERVAIWICSKFTRDEIEQIIQHLQDILLNRNPEVKPKDDFKEKHPNYRNFFVDPEPPLTTCPRTPPKLNWKLLLAEYKKQNGYPLKPV